VRSRPPVLVLGLLVLGLPRTVLISRRWSQRFVILGLQLLFRQPHAGSFFPRPATPRLFSCSSRSSRSSPRRLLEWQENTGVLRLLGLLLTPDDCSSPQETASRTGRRMPGGQKRREVVHFFSLHYSCSLSYAPDRKRRCCTGLCFSRGFTLRISGPDGSPSLLTTHFTGGTPCTPPV